MSTTIEIVHSDRNPDITKITKCMWDRKELILAGVGFAPTQQIHFLTMDFTALREHIPGQLTLQGRLRVGTHHDIQIECSVATFVYNCYTKTGTILY